MLFDELPLYSEFNITITCDFLFEVLSDVAVLFLDFSDVFDFGGGTEVESDFVEEFFHVISQVSASQVVSLNGVGESVAFIDGYGVSDSVSCIEDETCCSAGRVEGEDSLDGQVICGYIELLEHDGGHTFSVLLGVSRGLSEEAGVLGRSDSQFIIEAVMPDSGHVVPVGNNTVLDGIPELEDSLFGLGLVSDVGLFVVEADHDCIILGDTNNTWEGRARSIVSGHTGLAHS